MKCRMNVSELQPPEKRQIVQAFLALKNPTISPSRIPAAAARVTAGGGTPNRYDDYVWLHNTVQLGAHRGPAFGPWHREFLHQLEFDLQQVSGNPDLTIPYWDWTTARSSGDAGWPFTDDFMGGFGDAGPGPTTGFISTGDFSEPSAWRMNIRLPGDADLTLKRSRGVPDATRLPTREDMRFGLGLDVPAGTTWPSIYDSAPWNDFDTSSPTDEQINAAFRKYLERIMHDGVHGWIGDAWEFVNGRPRDGGHMTFPSVAVNDPMFWLHHCNVDRLWSIWQRQRRAANQPWGHLPQAGGTANSGHNGGDLMINLSDQSWFATTLLPRPNDVQDHQLLGHWYRTDVPQITLDTPSVSFGDVPELRTTFMPVTFSVRTCQPVHFAITAVAGNNFSAPADQGVVTVDHDHASDVVTARVYLQFQANGPLGAPQAGAATIVASITDTDGYDSAAPGDPRILGIWTVNCTATPVPRPRAAVALVLDRSGSMASGAGAAGSRYDVLKSSLAVVRDVMRPLDAVGVVTFDDVTTVLAPVSEMGPDADPPAPGSGRTALNDVIASADLVPRNTTAVGQGLIDGAAVLDAERGTAGSPYQRLALCVMTDGNENEDPRVADPAVTAAIAPYADGIYAIGLGRPGHVSDAVLSSVSNYMLVTGDITTAERRFRLTKYFVQILAGITGTAIVVDPQGDLHVGSEHRIPFDLCELDLEVEIIALSPLAPLLDMTLEAPDGTVVEPGAGIPTVQYEEHLDDIYYRLTLPLEPGTARTGHWTAVLRLTREKLQEHADDLPGWQERLNILAEGGTLPYSLIVQSYSDLEMNVRVTPTVLSFRDTVELFAELTASGQPFRGGAEISAAVTDPRGREQRVPLGRTGDGQFHGTFVPSLPGLYTIRFLGIGAAPVTGRFQREETRTTLVFEGDIPPGQGSPEDDTVARAAPHRGEAESQNHGTENGRQIHMIDSAGSGTDDEETAADEEAAAFGLLSQPHPAVPAGETSSSAQDQESDSQEHGDHDHSTMFFSMFHREPSGRIVEITPDEIERDTSTYDEEGHDPGSGASSGSPDHPSNGHLHESPD